MPYSLVIKFSLIFSLVFNICLTKAIAQDTTSNNLANNSKNPANLKQASPILKNESSSKSPSPIANPAIKSPAIPSKIASPTNPVPSPSPKSIPNTNANPSPNTYPNPNLNPNLNANLNSNSNPNPNGSNNALNNQTSNNNPFKTQEAGNNPSPNTNSSNPSATQANPASTNPNSNTSNNPSNSNPTSNQATPTENKTNTNNQQDLTTNNNSSTNPVDNNNPKIAKKKTRKKIKKTIAKPSKKNIAKELNKLKSKEVVKKNFITESGRNISSDYFLKIIPKKSCDNLTNTECFRRDRKNEEPYFHKTHVSIFNNRIVAEQFFNSNNSNKRIFLKVNNGDYQLKTTNDNLISFTVKNGLVSDLVLVSGNLNREVIMASKCQFAEKYYGYYLAYNQHPKISETSYFSNKNNFNGIRNLVLFSNIENIDELTLQDIMAVEIESYNNISSIENLNLCKRAKSDILDVRPVSKMECRKRQECLILLNSNPDFKDKIIDESCLGYFDSKREDFTSCSQQDDCEDYAVIKNCEVKLVAGE